MLNAGQIIGLMQHCLGDTPDPRHNLWATLNRAGRELFTSHDWGFRHRGPIALPVVANQSFIVLPADWMAVEDAYVSAAGTYSWLQQTTLREIMAYRASSTLGYVQGGLMIYWPNWASQATNEDQPYRRAEIYPTPTAAGEPTIQAYYLAGWANITQDDNEAIPNLPDEFEQAIVSKARALAWTTENQSQSADDTVYASEIARLKADDNRAQSDFGRSRGGAGDRMQRNRVWDYRYPVRAAL